MTEVTGNLRCALGCWGMGVLAGGLGAVMVRLLGGLSWPGSVFCGLILFVMVGLVLSALLCRPLPTMASIAAAPTMARPDKANTDQAIVAPVVAPEPAMVAAPMMAAAIPERAVAADGKPQFMTSARQGKADDLKAIKGVGPKLEAMLHQMGVFHFDQVAGWRPAEIAWVDDNLEGFKGRVSRDHWVEQAKVLAAGGSTAFSERVEKGEVY